MAKCAQGRQSSDFVKEWSRGQHIFLGKTTTESTVAELFMFENAKLAKKLEVAVWTLAQHCTLHYAFLLQVSDI